MRDVATQLKEQIARHTKKSQSRNLLLVCIVLLFTAGAEADQEMSDFFTKKLPSQEWVEFEAAGFSSPVTGVIYREGEMLPGMPLGALGTGFVSLGTDGTLDYVNTIFNTYQIRGGGGPQQRHSVPAKRMPFLGLTVGGETRVLSLKEIQGVPTASQIDY